MSSGTELVSAPPATRWLDPFRPQGIASARGRRVFGWGAVTALLGFVVLAVPGRRLEMVFGALRDDDGTLMVPWASLFAAVVCLLVATLCAAHAARGTKGERITFLVLAVLSLGVFGPSARLVIQGAALHGFYAGGAGARYDWLTRYWGLTLLVLVVVPALAVTAAVVASLLPAGRDGSRYARRRRSVSTSTAAVCAPVVVTLIITTLTLVLPDSVLTNLGYSTPLLEGGDHTYSASGMAILMWQSFQRIGYLPLLIGMWAGMESARAAFTLTHSNPGRVVTRAIRRLPLAAGAVAVLAVVAVVRGYYVTAVAGLVVVTLLALASAAVFDGLTSVDRLERGDDLGVSDEWQSAAPIAQFLLVLSLPAWLPVAWDNARGVLSPYLLVHDFDSFTDFWRRTPVSQVDLVSVEGIFVDRLHDAGVLGLTLAALVIVGVVINLVIGEGLVENAGWMIFHTTRLGLLALAALAITRHADDWQLGPLLALCGVPVLHYLFSRASAGGATAMAQFLVAAALIGIWAWFIGTTSALPVYTIFVATVVWRFVVRAGDLNPAPGRVDEEAARRQLRLLAAFGALTFLALGMMLIDHGGDQNIYATSAFATTSDQVGLTVVAAVWLVHLFSSSLRPQLTSPDSARQAQ